MCNDAQLNMCVSILLQPKVWFVIWRDGAVNTVTWHSTESACLIKRKEINVCEWAFLSVGCHGSLCVSRQPLSKIRGVFFVHLPVCVIWWKTSYIVMDGAWRSKKQQNFKYSVYCVLIHFSTRVAPTRIKPFFKRWWKIEFRPLFKLYLIFTLKI